MGEQPIIISEISIVKEDYLLPGHPYIPTVPRIRHAAAIITSGSLRYSVGGQSTVLSKGEILFIKAGNIDISETASADPVFFYTVDFQTVSDAFDMDLRYSGKNDVLLPAFRQLAGVFNARGINWKMECIELLYRILNELRRGGTSDGSDTYRYQRIAPAMEMIKKQLSDSGLTVTALAEVCGMSTVSLNRSFHQLYGMPVSRYLTDRRMENAKILLLNATNSVSEVAERVGYRDIYTFSHSFTKFFGVSPQTWRRQPDEKDT